MSQGTPRTEERDVLKRSPGMTHHGGTELGGSFVRYSCEARRAVSRYRWYPVRLYTFPPVIFSCMRMEYSENPLNTRDI